MRWPVELYELDQVASRVLELDPAPCRTRLDSLHGLDTVALQVLNGLVKISDGKSQYWKARSPRLPGNGRLALDNRQMLARSQLKGRRVTVMWQQWQSDDMVIEAHGGGHILCPKADDGELFGLEW